MKDVKFRILGVKSKDYKYLLSKCTGVEETQRFSNDGKFVVLQMKKEDSTDKVKKRHKKHKHKYILELMETDNWKIKESK